MSSPQAVASIRSNAAWRRRRSTPYSRLRNALRAPAGFPFYSGCEGSRPAGRPSLFTGGFYGLAIGPGQDARLVLQSDGAELIGLTDLCVRMVSIVTFLIRRCSRMLKSVLPCMSTWVSSCRDFVLRWVAGSSIADSMNTPSWIGPHELEPLHAPAATRNCEADKTSAELLCSHPHGRVEKDERPSRHDLLHEIAGLTIYFLVAQICMNLIKRYFLGD